MSLLLCQRVAISLGQQAGLGRGDTARPQAAQEGSLAVPTGLLPAHQPVGQGLGGDPFGGTRGPAHPHYLVGPSCGPTQAHTLQQVLWPPSRQLQTLVLGRLLLQISLPSGRLWPWPMPPCLQGSLAPQIWRPPAKSSGLFLFTPWALEETGALCIYYLCHLRFFFYCF